MIDIAIVGIGCRVPGGATDANEFWDFVLRGGDGMREVPADRWDIDRYYDADPDAPGRMYTRQGGFLDQSPYEFDPEYFGISPREAAIMDPQQRLLLEVAVEALDDAGLGPRVTGRDVGVYVGGFTSDNMAMRHSRAARAAISSHTATSGTFTMLSNRLSFVLDLHGPSMTIDTACSSSLVAVHEAAQAVARGECEVAIAGGVNVMLQPETFVSMCKGRFLAPDGRCKTFDADADGYARGEGAGAVVLKPLAAARADRDRVYAVIRATGANQDGRTSGITVPNPEAQAALARRVLGESGLDAAEIGYVEAHGTGTAVGDPLEVRALGTVYGDVPGRHTPLVVGSVKAGVGHLEAAAGVTSVIKAALTVHHGTIAPQAWLKQLNPAIPFDEYRVEVPTEARPFPAGYAQRAVAVNGFGYGGTNAHVVLTGAPVDEVDSTDSGPAAPAAVSVFPVSGRTDGAARAAAGALADALDGADDAQLQAAQAAAWGRRLHHPQRAAFGWQSGTDLVESLRTFAGGAGRAATRALGADPVGPVFVFSGMGPQWWRMGRDLLTRDGAYATTARQIDEQFREIAGWSIIEELLADEAGSRVPQTAVAQPANFLLQVSLTAELAELGITPAAVVGHSVGEVSAAYVSGVLSLHDALLVSYHRARLQATTAGSGGMLAVGLPEHEAVRRIGEDPRISVAAVNSPSSVTVAGDQDALQELAQRLEAEGAFARALRVEVPYHSHLMDPILDDVRAVLAPLQPRIARLPLYSTVTATRVTDAAWGADYWVDNVRRPVRFADTVTGLLDDGHRLFLEVGPHPVLGGNIRELVVGSEHSAAVVATLSRNADDAASLRQTVADLYCAGGLDTTRQPGAAAAPVAHAPLPAYPWQRARLWTEVAAMQRDRLGTEDALPLLGERDAAAAPQWQAELSTTTLPWLPDHVVDGLVLLPGAAYLDAALSAASQLTARPGQALADVRFRAPRIIDGSDVPVLRLAVEPTTGRFTIDSRSATAEEAGGGSDAWTRNVTGRIVDGDFTAGAHDFAPADGSRVVSPDVFYTELAARGLEYGPWFRRITEARVSDDSLVARVDSSADGGHLAHPAVVDAALQCVAALAARRPDVPQGPMVPFGVGSVRRFGALPAGVQVSVTLLDRAGLHADIALADEHGTVRLELLDVEFRPVRPAASWSAELEPLWYEMVWRRWGNLADRPAPGVSAGSLVVVTTAATPPPAATALIEGYPRTRTVRLGQEDSVDRLDIELRAALASPGPVTVAYVPGPAREPGVAASAGLLAVAGAVQGVLDSRLLADSGRADTADIADRVRGVVLTEQAIGLPGDIAEVQLGLSALVGLRRTLRNEQPELQWRLVDVEGNTPAAHVVSEVLDPGTGSDDAVTDSSADAVADEVALRGGLRLVTTLRRSLPEHVAESETATPVTDPEESFRVEVPTSSLISDLALRRVERVAPGVGQVEVRVLSAGLNYKDSAKVLGLLTARELAGTYFGTDLGMEAIAVVTRVGPGVDAYRVGDRLSVGERDSLARYLTIDVDGGGAVSLAPSTWSDTDSALNLPFLTAHHSLVDVARVQPGDTVLVHGAAGGVGLAALQVAKRCGAFVIGTAGSAQRRAAALEAGADVVLDSRSLNFVEDVRAVTGGAGADVVLNSAPGDVIAANLDAAAEFGRIVEIGKADIYTGGVIPLAPFDRNLSFHAVDIDRLLAKRRPVVLALVDTVNAAFESGEYRPLPTTVYPLARLGEAFEAVARGSNVGRVVLDFRDDAESPAPLARPRRPELRFRTGASYLVTGGFGAFGLATARWLGAAGAGCVVLVGRSGATTDAAEKTIASLEKLGVEVVQVSLDVSDRAQVDSLIDRLVAEERPPAGVFHAAGVLDDRPFTDIDLASLETVFAPKAVGAWNLHEATLDLDLDYFVTYSSASAFTGTVPQASYAAANTVLDSLVRVRRALGLHGVTVNWGALSGGMAGSSDEVERYLATIGLNTLDIDVAARMLGHALALDVTQVGILDIDWTRWGATHPMSAGTPRFAAQIADASAAGSESSQLQADLIALPEGQRGEVVAYMLAEQVATVLGIPSETIDLEVPLPDLGLDSLMAVELQARVNLALGVEVSALEFSRGGGLRSLAGRVLPLLGAGEDESLTTVGR